MAKKTSCIGGTEVKHTYEARYEEREPDPMATFFSMKREDIKKDRLYVYDICVACGDIIKREHSR